MTPLLKKLNYKQQKEVCLINPPEEFQVERKAIEKQAAVRTDLKGVKEIEFVLAFVKTRAEIKSLTPLIAKKLKGDGVVWYAYPKGTSKKYKSEVNRDSGWEVLGEWNFEPVRQVAIDDDWSALRFRDVQFIKTMNRRTESAMTKEGKQKTKKKDR